MPHSTIENIPLPTMYIKYYLFLSHCTTQINLTQIFSLCHTILQKLFPCPTLYERNHPIVQHCSAQIFPFFHTKLQQYFPCATMYDKNLSPFATLYYTNNPMCNAILHIFPLVPHYYTNYPLPHTVQHKLYPCAKLY